MIFTEPPLQLLALAFFAMLKLPIKTTAFTNKLSHLRHSTVPAFGSTNALQMATPNHDWFDEGDDGSNDSNDIDDEFYRDLQRAKEEKLGGSTSKTPMEKNEDGQFNYDDGDNEFYRDLQRAKLEKLGGSIPPEQARESAEQAEADFLQAMKETKSEFEKAKEELGSDGAVDLFLDRIREEDKLREEEENDEHD